MCSLVDLITLSIFLGVSPAVREGFNAHQRGEKKDMTAFKQYLQNVCTIQKNGCWWMHEVGTLLIYLSIYKPIYPAEERLLLDARGRNTTYLSIYLQTYLSTYLSIFLSIQQKNGCWWMHEVRTLLVYLSIYKPIYLSIDLSIYQAEERLLVDARGTYTTFIYQHNNNIYISIHKSIYISLDLYCLYQVILTIYHLSVYLSIHPSIYLYITVSTYISYNVTNYISIYLYLFKNLSIYTSIHQSIYPQSIYIPWISISYIKYQSIIYLSTNLSIHLSIYPPIHLYLYVEQS